MDVRREMYVAAVRVLVGFVTSWTVTGRVERAAELVRH
jgi:hypothetical protein